MEKRIVNFGRGGKGSFINSDKRPINQAKTGPKTREEAEIEWEKITSRGTQVNEMAEKMVVIPIKKKVEEHLRIESLTEGILHIFLNWELIAEGMYKKGIISQEEIYLDGKWLLTTHSLTEGVKECFPEFVVESYESKEVLRKSVSSMLSQAKNVFGSEMIREVENSKGRRKAIYSTLDSEEFKNFNLKSLWTFFVRGRKLFMKK